MIGRRIRSYEEGAPGLEKIKRKDHLSEESVRHEEEASLVKKRKQEAGYSEATGISRIGRET